MADTDAGGFAQSGESSASVRNATHRLACAPGMLQVPPSPKYGHRFSLYRCITVIVVPVVARRSRIGSIDRFACAIGQLGHEE